MALGEMAHAEGQETQANGGCSHAEGYGTIASGECSHAEGGAQNALGDYSHAEGKGTTADGDNSHAEGVNSIAEGKNSHAEGSNTVAKGSTSHAEGLRTIALADYSHVQGKNNIEDTEKKYAHIVGNGQSSTSRSNAHTLDWDGNAWYAGSVTGTNFIITNTDGTTSSMGDLNAALEAIIAIQEELMGESSITLITFSIDGTEYQAEEGMTWKEWADSEYNTIGAIANSGELIWVDGCCLVQYYGGMGEEADSIIIANTNYLKD